MVALRDAALSYAARGWAVFPLRAGDKTPATARGFKDATTDADQICAWWDRNPRYNIGIATGAVSGFVVLDTDGPDAEAHVALQGDVATLRQTTAKGQHRIYRHPGHEVRNTTRLHGVDGLDIRGDGGYIVAAPSVHPTGAVYQWENESDLAPLPEWVTRKPEQARPSMNGSHTSEDRYAQTALNNELATLARCQNGTRNDTLFKVARRVNEFVQAGRLPATVFDEIETVAARTGLQAVELARTIASARNGGSPELDGLPRTNGTAHQAASAAPLGEPPRFRSDDQAGDVLTTANRTDEGNAECFVSLYGDTYRYCGTRGLWLRWTGAYWQADDRKTTERAAIDTARQRYHAAAGIDDLETRKRAAAWAISSESQAKASATLRAAEKHLIALIDDYDNAPLLAAAANQTIDLLTGQARAGNREDMLSMALGTSYDPAATCPKWDQFIGEVFSGDPELVRYVQRAVGYSLTGDTSEQKLFLCYGNGANGKSVFLDTIAALLGDYAATAAFDTFDANKRSEATNDLAMLKAKRFVTITESEQDKRLAEARVKQITGGDSITCRFLHREFFTYRPTFKIWLAMNHLPTIRGTDRGIWRRIQVLPFLESFEGRENRKLPRELLQELPGILNWALQGLQDWHANGLGNCQAVQQATSDYKQDQDKLGRWMSECTIQAPRATVTVKAAWANYQAWCEDNNVYPGTKRAWASELKQRGYEPERIRKEWTHTGFGLLPDGPDPETEPAPEPETVTQVTQVTQNPVFTHGKNPSRGKCEITSPTSLTSPAPDKAADDLPHITDDHAQWQAPPPATPSADALACQSAIDAGDLPAAQRALVRLAAGDGATYRAYRREIDRLAAQQQEAAAAGAADQATWEVQ